MYRVSESLLVSNYLSDVRKIQLDLARLLQQTSTGLAIERPRQDPAGSATSIELRSAINYLTQYTRNVDDGASRLEYTETAINEVDAQLQRARELTVQAANSYLTRSDRQAIAEEMHQLLEHVITIANANFRGRYIFSGFETLTAAFDSNMNTQDGMTNSITYRGDYGAIARNIGVERDLDVNFSGKQVFLEQTYTLTGRQMSGEKLGFNGAFELNDQLFVVTPEMTLGDLRDMINQNPDTEVFARIDSDFRLVLESLNSSQPIEVRDIAGTILADTGILPLGAFNVAQSAPTLPLVDSTGAIHDNAAAPLAFPLTLSTAQQDMVVTLSGAANDGFTQTEVLKLDAITYNTAAELVAEIQKKADIAFGEEKLIVRDMGGGVIELETFVQSGSVLASDFRLGGTAPDGTVDTASTVLGLNNAGPGPWDADFAGTDGNDRFTIDLGLSAYRTVDDGEPLDLPPVEINIDATMALTVDSLVADINDKIRRDELLSGLVEAVNDGGRLRLETTRRGAEVLADDMIIANAVTGPVTDPPLPADPWDTLRALGFYRDPTTGVSAPPIPAVAQGSLNIAGAVPYTVTFGVNDTFTIDLGPGASLDGTNPDPVTIVLNPGVYATTTDVLNEINFQINNSAVLKNAVTAQLRTVGPQQFIDIVTFNESSRVQASDLVVSNVSVNTPLRLGVGPLTTIPGGGTAAGQGLVEEPHNLIDTMVQVRDELFGYAARQSRLTDLTDVDGNSLGLFPGYTVRVSSDGSFLEFTVQRFTTMQDLADKIEEKLGFQLEVDVLRDGTIRVFNPTTGVINDVSVEAFDLDGGHITAFEDKFASISGRLSYRSELTSETAYEDERFHNMTERIGDMDDALEGILSTLAMIGSRSKRLELTLSQNETVSVNLLDLQSQNDYVDMAETLIKLQEAQNVLNSALGAGARVLPPSLFDFLS